MNILAAQALLVRAANIYQERSVNFSRQDIQKTMGELKYLVSQKKIPRISLRRQMITLDDQLQGLYELERKLMRQRKEESIRIKALKHQISYFKHKLTAIEDPHLPKKVERLSHVLGECLAQLSTEKEVETKKMEIKNESASENKDQNISTLKILQQRLSALKQEIEKSKTTKMNGENYLALEKKAELLEQKLKQILSKDIPPPFPERNSNMIKHDLLLNQELQEKSLAEALKLKPPQPVR